MNRPALAHTLAALTDGHVARYTDVESVHALGPITRPGYGCWPWAVETPADAVEVLATRALWPWPVGDDASPRWWCERCQGCGWLPGWQHCECVGDPEHEYGHTADPPTLAALVAVASLGVDTLRRAEGLALQLVGRTPRIVWRVMTREKLRLHHATVKWDTRADQTAPAWLFSFQADLALSPHEYMRSLAWRNAASAHEAHPAWPALRDLHGLGLHLVALDGDRITLAVEAI